MFHRNGMRQAGGSSTAGFAEVPDGLDREEAAKIGIEVVLGFMLDLGGSRVFEYGDAAALTITEHGPGNQYLAMYLSEVVLDENTGGAVQLLVEQLYQVAHVGLGEDVLPEVGDDKLLKGLGVEPAGLAGSAASLEEGVGLGAAFVAAASPKLRLSN